MVIELNTVLIAGSASLSLLALGAVVVLHRTAARWQARCRALESGVAALHREIERRVSLSMRTASQRAENRSPGNSLGNAIDSARRGADPRRLTQQFGLSRAEAELMARMHGQSLRSR